MCKADVLGLDQLVQFPDDQNPSRLCQSQIFWISYHVILTNSFLVVISKCQVILLSSHSLGIERAQLKFAEKNEKLHFSKNNLKIVVIKKLQSQYLIRSWGTKKHTRARIESVPQIKEI